MKQSLFGDCDDKAQKPADRNNAIKKDLKHLLVVKEASCKKAVVYPSYTEKNAMSIT